MSEQEERKTLTTSLPMSLYNRLRLESLRDNRSLAKEILVLLKEALDTRDRQNPDRK